MRRPGPPLRFADVVAHVWLLTLMSWWIMGCGNTPARAGGGSARRGRSQGAPLRDRRGQRPPGGAAGARRVDSRRRAASRSRRRSCPRDSSPSRSSKGRPTTSSWRRTRHSYATWPREASSGRSRYMPMRGSLVLAVYRELGDTVRSLADLTEARGEEDRAGQSRDRSLRQGRQAGARAGRAVGPAPAQDRPGRVGAAGLLYAQKGTPRLPWSAVRSRMSPRSGRSRSIRGSTIRSSRPGDRRRLARAALMPRRSRSSSWSGRAGILKEFGFTARSPASKQSSRQGVAPCTGTLMHIDERPRSLLAFACGSPRWRRC